MNIYWDTVNVFEIEPSTFCSVQLRFGKFHLMMDLSYSACQ